VKDMLGLKCVCLCWHGVVWQSVYEVDGIVTHEQLATPHIHSLHHVYSLVSCLLSSSPHIQSHLDLSYGQFQQRLHAAEEQTR
jgi:hypothetical protein